jgi:hypothetical protein
MSFPEFFSEKIRHAIEYLFYPILMLVVRWHPPSFVVDCSFQWKYTIHELDREEEKSYSGINLGLTRKENVDGQ